MLGTYGESAVMPAHCEQTRCFKNLWDYDLTYSGDTFDGVVEEINQPRNNCPGFTLYEAGFSPALHLESQIEHRKEKLHLRIANRGFLGAILGGIVGTIILAFLKRLLK